MTDFREGDWVEHKLTKCRGPVENISRGMLENPGGWSRVEMYEHCAPTPLPERLPKGTLAESCGFRCVAASEMRMEFGDRYRGNWDTDDFASFCFAKDIDWPSYWAALHAEQDALLAEANAAKSKATPAAYRREIEGYLAEQDAAKVNCAHRRVNQLDSRCDDCGLTAKQRFEQEHADALSDNERLARTVECPDSDLYAEHEQCRAKPGEGCRTMERRRRPRMYHADRLALARARRAEQDSPQHRSDCIADAVQTARPSGGDSGQGRAAGSEVMTPISQPAAPSGFPKCVHCESSSAMAIGHADWCPVHRAHVMEQPQAPSGFRAPIAVYQVDCEACGAKNGAACTDRLGEVIGVRKEPHALRVAAFEARMVRHVETGFIPKFKKCLGLVDVGGKKCGAEVMRTGGSRLCGDCRASLDSAHNDRSRRGKGILRTDLDRPLPPKPAALRTWPEHWATPGWES